MRGSGDAKEGTMEELCEGACVVSVVELYMYTCSFKKQGDNM